MTLPLALFLVWLATVGGFALGLRLDSYFARR